MLRPSGLKVIEGGVTAPLGFKAAGVHAGLKKEKLDLALLTSEVPAAAAAVYTKNKVKAAPLMVTREHLKHGYARAVVVNSGNANACTGEQGLRDARFMAEVTAAVLHIPVREVVVASTGVIGVPLPMDKVEAGIRAAAANLSREGGVAAAEAILTTDTCTKEVAVALELGGRTVHIGAMAKGSGMIHPNMATMLAFLTTDLRLEPEILQRALSAVTEKTFNMVTVDGDTSTNDMVVILANGLAGNASLSVEEHACFREALEFVCCRLARMIARDGEGATKLIEVQVYNAPSEADARRLARAVAGSNLVKAAVFGADANWGRIITAAGYSGAEMNPERVDIYLASRAGREQVAANGAGLPFSEERAAAILAEEEITIILDLKLGSARATAWGCDLTYDYVRINAAYRT
ncbi:MAG: glutamate N-acetyltransferase / amino-acid N-acetyltransferase [Clostridia bacterium]|nr:glutamate N-acetyltransferase / amino-acid N-acetyltransferase [Clostridia bacterium]